MPLIQYLKNNMNSIDKNKHKCLPSEIKARRIIFDLIDEYNMLVKRVERLERKIKEHGI